MVEVDIRQQMIDLIKRRVEYEGMDCLTDEMSPAYMAAGDASQAEIPWASNEHYGKVTVYYGVAIIFLAFLKHIWFSYSDRRYKKPNGVQTGYFGSIIAILTSYSRYFGYKPVNIYISKYLGLPATSGSFLFVIASTAYLACYTLIPHFWYRGCRGFGSPPLAVRLGIMSTALLPFVYTLSGKFNMITLLTGISYEKLNVFHQFTGVASFVLAIVHTIPFIQQALAEGGFSNLKVSFQSLYFYSGIPPLILMAFLTLGGLSIVRKYWYEAFVHIHWICGCAFYGTLVWHIQQSLNMWDYMWAALAFWMFQLIYRALVKTCFKPNSFFLKPRPATLRKLDSNTFEVIVKNVPDLKWLPGQHCYLRFTGSKILDNHPFSISSIPKINSNELKFIIIPRNGFTGELFQELNDSITLDRKVFIDGPYGGSTRDTMSFDTLTMISSGSGVTVCMPFLQDAAQSIRNAIDTNQSYILKDLRFIWIVRCEENISWIRQELDEAIKLASDCISIDIYIVNGGSEKLESSSDCEKDDDARIQSHLIISNKINVHYQKPDLPSILEESKTNLKRRNMFVSSGSALMRRQVCSSISNLQRIIFNQDHQIQQQPIEEIFLHTEAFGW